MNKERSFEQFDQRQAAIERIREALQQGNLGLNSLNDQTGRDWTREQWEERVKQMEQELSK